MFSWPSSILSLHYDFLVFLRRLLWASPSWLQGLVKSGFTAFRLLDYHFVCCVDRVWRVFRADDDTLSSLYIPQSRVCNTCRKIDFAALVQPDRTRHFPWRTWRYAELGSGEQLRQRSASCELCHTICEAFDGISHGQVSLREQEFDKPIIRNIEAHTEHPASKIVHFKAVVDGNHGRIDILHFQLCPFPLMEGTRIEPTGSSGRGHLTGRLLADKSNSPRLYKEWLRLCCSTHQDLCNDEALRWRNDVNINLIEVKTGKLIPLNTSARYLTLSYVWGRDGHFELTRANSTRLMTSGINCTLPKTVEEAMSMVHSLGEQYLWVDRLCIVQDDPAHKQHQMAHMGLIYSRAVCTVVAAAGESAQCGLWPHRHRSVHRQQCLRIGRNTLMSVVTPHPFKGDTHNSWTKDHEATQISQYQWSKRAWTMQEILLSRRALVFAVDQVYWHCRSADWLEETALEPNPWPLNRKIGAKRSLDQPSESSQGQPSSFVDHFRSAAFAVAPLRRLREETNELWNQGATAFEPLQAYMQLAEDYTLRSMSRSGDNYTAFAGVLTALADHYPFMCPGLPGIDFLFALPKHDLPWGLAWSCSGLINLHRRRPSTSDSEDLNKALATTPAGPPMPSWSWAAWYSDDPNVKGVRFQGRDKHQLVQVTEPLVHFYLVYTREINGERTMAAQWIDPRQRSRPSMPSECGYGPPPEMCPNVGIHGDYSPADWLNSPAGVNCDALVLSQQLTPGTLLFYTSAAMLPILRYKENDKVNCVILGPGYMQAHSQCLCRPGAPWYAGTNSLIGFLQMGALDHFSMFEHENNGYVSRDYRAALYKREGFGLREELERGDILMFEFCVVCRHVHDDRPALSVLAVEWIEGVAYRVGIALIDEADWVHVLNRNWKLITLA